jgi:hypothetical protein
VLEARGVTRHVQFKSSSLVAKTARQTIHKDLASKPSGCVVWMHFDQKSLSLGPFRFFGGAPGAPLPAIDGFRVAKHAKGNAQGLKLERPKLRVVPRAHFATIASIPELYEALFGSNRG